MALSPIKTWVAGEVLTAADLVAEFANIYNNGASLVQPWTGSFDLNGNLLVLDNDADTLLDTSVDDTIDVTIAGADDFRFTANTFTALSGSSVTLDAGALTVTDGQTTLADPDARTNSVATPLIVAAETSGTPAAGIGTGILVKAESADEVPCNFGQLDFSASDVTAGSEDTYFRIWLRVAGAALTECWRWAATGAFKGIFTHANSADRTYTLPNYDGTLATLAGTETFTNKTFDAQGTGNSLTNVSTSALKTSTGSITSSPAGIQDIVLNDYSFAPSLTSGANDTLSTQNIADPSTTVARLSANVPAGTIVFRWRYVTASDEPTIWVIPDADGNILSVWASDDPVRYHEDVYEEDPVTGLIVKRKRWRVLDEPPIVIRGSAFTARQIPLAMLANMALPQKALDSADRHIEVNKLKPANRLYRALQMHTKDDAPSTWLMNECIWKGNEFRKMTAQEKAAALSRRP